MLGKHALDGFKLALATLGGKLGGREAELVIVDDELKPDLAVNKAQALIDRDKVDFVVGPIFSNVLAAIMKPVTESKTFLISPNAGPSSFAGKACNPYFYVMSYENDRIHAVSGTYAQEKGYKRVFLLAPNYQAGKDAVTGFKSAFKGEIVDEAHIRRSPSSTSRPSLPRSAAKPDALYVFMPGGLGVEPRHKAPPAGSAIFRSCRPSRFVDDRRRSPSRMRRSWLLWRLELGAQSRHAAEQGFLVAALREGLRLCARVSYAFEAYDAALLDRSCPQATGGKTSDKEALRAALKKADFQPLARRLQVQQ